MEREPFIFGKNLAPEDAEAAKTFLKEKCEESFKPLEGEFEKTPEELKMVDKINSYAAEEFKELGIEGLSAGVSAEESLPAGASAKEGKPFVPPEQIHFLSEAAYRRHFPEVQDKTNAFHDVKTGAIYADKPRYSKLQLFNAILHESLHTLSLHKYYAEAGERSAWPLPYRGGYDVRHPRKFHEHFRGLNEAVTDAMTREIVEKHREELAEELRLSPREKEEQLYYYDNYLKILDKIIDGIAGKKKEDRNEVWKRFKRGLFTGEMMHLRDIEKTFGKGALKVVAVMGVDHNFLVRDAVAAQIMNYFETDDPKERQRIARMVLAKGIRRIEI